ncbi:MAG: C10 family peptidase [Verrucomicrobiae bacterium]|nr:C10 family peptidase [Verrucomicrobiae bacterium]
MKSLIGMLMALAMGVMPIASPGSSPQPVKEIQPLLTTKWGMGHQYAQLTPNQALLGCWAVAIAQILYYHRIQPTGTVEYEGPGYRIAESLGEHRFNWQLFADSLTPSTSSEVCSEVARYCYFTAIAIGKTFPEGYQGNSDHRRAGIQKHFGVSSQAYSRAGSEAIRQAILSELSQKRPLLLYIEGLQPGPKLGHALVIDGVRTVGDSFEVHLNCGWYGSEDGWYAFEQPIRTSRGLFDNPTRWVYAIRPNN